jgi:enterochelin esterase-like enzyme
MNYINTPGKLPENVTHKVFVSNLYNHELGYNVCLPPDYEYSRKSYPVTYHLHGWEGNESSEIWTMEKVYTNRQAITIFPNSSPVIEDSDNLPVEQMLIYELMPLIESEYKTVNAREGRSLSGFSMGGGAAFVYAVKYLDLFSEVTAYAGTYHHYFHNGSRTVGAAPEKATELYDDMMREERYLEEGNVLCMVRQNADAMRGHLKINLRIGADDVLFCDNEILHMYLTSLNIPHDYMIIEQAGHELGKIIW